MCCLNPEPLCSHASNQRVNQAGKSSFHGGNEECVWGKFFKAKDPLPAQLASAPVRSRGAVSLPFSACCAYPALPIPSLRARAVQQPAGSLPSSCAAGFQQFFPASQGTFRCWTFLYVCAWQPAPLPRHRGFPRWALQITSALGPRNRGLCRKEFAGQRVELSCATLFLSAVTVTWRQHPQGFGNSQAHWLAPLDAFGLRDLCSQP